MTSKEGLSVLLMLPPKGDQSIGPIASVHEVPKTGNDKGGIYGRCCAFMARSLRGVEHAKAQRGGNTDRQLDIFLFCECNPVCYLSLFILR